MGLHPKRCLATLGQGVGDAFRWDKNNVVRNDRKAGRDTERDLFGVPGGYATLLSQKTYGQPCPVCGGQIIKETYMGGQFIIALLPAAARIKAPSQEPLLFVALLIRFDGDRCFFAEEFFA